MSDGTATVGSTDEGSIDAAAVESAVESAGFTPRGMVAAIVGTIERRGSELVVRWADGAVRLSGGDAFGRAEKASGRVLVRGALTRGRDSDPEAPVWTLRVEDVDHLDRVEDVDHLDRVEDVDHVDR